MFWSKKGSGVIATPVTNKIYEEHLNREKVTTLIREKCGSKYEIIREEEVAIAEVEEYSVKRSDQTVLKSKVRDYRISYICQ